jgi:hypothetical protein
MPMSKEYDQMSSKLVEFSKQAGGILKAHKMIRQPLKVNPDITVIST